MLLEDNPSEIKMKREKSVKRRTVKETAQPQAQPGETRETADAKDVISASFSTSNPSITTTTTTKSYRKWRRKTLVHGLVVVLILSLTTNIVSLVVYSDYLFSQWVRLVECGAETRLNFRNVNLTLHETIVGQDDGINLLIQQMSNYLASNSETSPFLLLSVHGSSGTGKTKLTDVLMDHFCYRCVQKIIIPVHFLEVNADTTHEPLIKFIIWSANSYCSVRLIIFEEMQYATSRLISILDESLNSLPHDLRNTKRRLTKTVIIFTSDVGAKAVDKYVAGLLIENYTRRDVSLPKIADLIVPIAILSKDFNPWGRFVAKHVKELRLIPFLPLESEHVKHCIKSKLQELGMDRERLVRHILKNIVFIPDHKPVIAENGCKEVEAKVNYWNGL